MLSLFKTTITMSVSTSKQMFINMNPKDIPYYDQRKPFWEQSNDTIQFFLAELDKITNGITIGGYKMHGWEYFHLNYFVTPIPQKTGNDIDMRPPLDDNTFYIMECYKQAEREGLGLFLWGTRGFAKSTYIASLKQWTILTKGGTSMLIGKERGDLDAIQKLINKSMGKIHPAFKVDTIRADWEADVDYGIKYKNDEDLVLSTIAVRNAEAGKSKASEKGAGLTPTGFVMDEALAFDSILYSREKELTMEEVTVGDKIYGDDGKLTTVIDKIDVGVVPMYEFTLSDGRKVESSADHIWRVYDHKLDVERGVRTEEIATKEFIEDENKKERKITRYSLPTTEPVNYPEIKVDVDFYQIGLSIKDYSDETINTYLRGSIEQRKKLLYGITYYEHWRDDRIKKFYNQLHYSLGNIEDYKYITIEKVKKSSVKQAYCIKVDNESNLFLTNDYIVTHNCGKYSPKEILLAAMPSLYSEYGARCTYILAGCVCKDTKVWNNKGELVNIQDLVQEEGILGYDLQNHKVSKEDITYWQAPHEKMCYRITTNKGRILECSDDHPILVRSKYDYGSYKAGKYEFKETKDLVVGDMVAVVNGMDEEFFNGEESMFDPYFVGMAIGDGHVPKHGGVHIFNADDDVKKYLQSKYETNIFFTADTKDGRTLEKFSVNGVKPFFNGLGLSGKVREFKRLPEKIYKYKKEDLVQLISGLYDADGCYYVGKQPKETTKKFIRKECVIKLTACGRGLLEDVQMLLTKFGIHGNITFERLTENSSPKSTRGHYNLLIKDAESMCKFAETFKPLIKYKREKLAEIKDIWKDVKKTSGKGVKHEKIKIIEKIGLQPVYNLTAGTTNTYIANGIVTHNTGGNSVLSEGAKEILMNPKDFKLSIMNWDLLNNMVPEEHITWKEDIGKQFSMFVPGQFSYRNEIERKNKKFSNFLRECKFTGKLESKSELDEMNIRTVNWEYASSELKRRVDEMTTDSAKIKQRMYLPLTIADSFLEDKSNIFDIERAKQKQLEIKKNPKYQAVTLARDETSGKFLRNFSDAPIAGREHTGKPINSPILIYGTFPETIPQIHRHVSSLDDYKQDKAETKSLGAFYVLERRMLDIDKPFETIKLSYASRPERHTDFWKNCEKGISAFNALCCMESADVGFVSYLEDTLKVNAYDYLTPAFSPGNEKVSKNRQTNSRFGIYPTPQNKQYLINLVLEYTNEQQIVGYDDTGKPIIKTGMDYIEDYWLLQEMIDYNPDANVDRIVAFGHALAWARRLDREGIRPKDDFTEKFKDQNNRNRAKIKMQNFSKVRYKNF